MKFIINFRFTTLCFFNINKYFKSNAQVYFNGTYNDVVEIGVFYNLYQTPSYLLKSIWNEEINKLENSKKREYFFDINKNPTLELYNERNIDLKDCNTYYIFEYLYYSSSSIENLFLPKLNRFLPDYSDIISNKPLESISFEYFNGNLVNKTRINYLYSPNDELTISSKILFYFNTYPNLSYDLVNIFYSDTIKVFFFDLFDSKFSKLISKKIANNHLFKTSEFNSERFFYKISIESSINYGKKINHTPITINYI